MRMSTYNTSRVIAVFDETEEYISIPRGLRMQLIQLLDDAGAKYAVIDEMNHGREIDVAFRGDLAIQQQEALLSLLNHENGVLSAATGFGKTVIGAALIGEKRINTLILVHSKQLAEQWTEQLEKFLLIKEIINDDEPKKRGRKRKTDLIGRLGGGKKQLNGSIDIAIMQSVINKSEVNEIVRDYGMVIVDECHHVSASSFDQILRAINAKYVYGMSATPIRKDGHHPIIFMHCGEIRYKVEARKQALVRPFDHLVIPRFTPFRKPAFQDEKDWHISEVYRLISQNDLRNRLIVGDVIASVNRRRTPIVLTERTKHVHVLADMLLENEINVVTLTGMMSAKERKGAMARIHGFAPDESFVIVATGRLIGEGFDEPRLDTLFLAMPVAWKGTVAQYAGRLHRIHDDKEIVEIYDYVDVHVGVLERMYHKRMKSYASIGYEIKVDAGSEAFSAIYEPSSYFEVLAEDMKKANNSIIISSPHLNRQKIKSIEKDMIHTYARGVRVVLVTRRIESSREYDRPWIKDLIERSRENGIDMILDDGVHQRFAVIDDEVIWYGSINILGHASEEDSIMRFMNREVANELTGIVSGCINC
jgi:superfamily II DNA or RNA helicase